MAVVCEMNVTVKPEVAVATKVSGVPTVWVPGFANVIVCDFSAAAFTAKLCETGGAASYALLPACEAWIVHVPADTNVAVVPLTVQMAVVCGTNVTVKPEVAVATKVSGVPTVWVPGFANVIVCDFNAAAFTVKLCETGVAAMYVLLPACEAWIVHVPADTNVAVVPLTVQMAVVCGTNVTVKPEVAVATKVSGVPTVWVPGFANVIVCDLGAAAFTVKLCETGVAAAYVLLPACEAWIVHVPADTNVAVVPLTVQMLGVCGMNVTVKPEVAVATNVSGVPTVCAPGFANAIVCDFNAAAFTVKLCETGVAAAYVLLPACEA
jgi:hypothetical protein